MIRKANVEIVLQQIANTILLNVGKVHTIGLLDGKMGISLFLYHYAQINENKVYRDFADELLDEVFNGISVNTVSVNFSRGLTGIAWGIRYLTEKKFVDTDTDVLIDVDAFLRNIDPSSILSDIVNECPFFSKGIYFIEKNDSELLKNMINLLNNSLGKNTTILPLNYYNSILYVILQGNLNLNMFADLLNTMYASMFNSINYGHFFFLDVLNLKILLEQLKQKQDASFEYERWISLLKSINSDQVKGIFNTGIYNLIYNKIENDDSLILNKLETIDIVSHINTMIKDVYRNLNLYNGLAGVGLTLCNYLQKF